VLYQEASVGALLKERARLQEEAADEQQEDEKNHPPGGFGSLSDGDTYFRSRGAGRY
jgi:hypothetical protein